MKQSDDRDKPSHYDNDRQPIRTRQHTVCVMRLCRFQHPANFRLSHQQLRSPGAYISATIQMPLADRTVFQMDKTTSENKGILWNIDQDCPVLASVFLIWRYKLNPLINAQ